MMILKSLFGGKIRKPEDGLCKPEAKCGSEQEAVSNPVRCDTVPQTKGLRESLHAEF